MTGQFNDNLLLILGRALGTLLAQDMLVLGLLTRLDCYFADLAAGQIAELELGS